MGNKKCFIQGCYHKQDDENEKRTVGFFCVPLTSLQAWQRLINKPGLSTSSRICSRHFDEADITKGRTILNVFYPYRVWRLNAGAMPKYHLGNGSNTVAKSLLYSTTENQGKEITVLKENLPVTSSPDVLKVKVITIQDAQKKSLPAPTAEVILQSSLTTSLLTHEGSLLAENDSIRPTIHLQNATSAIGSGSTSGTQDSQVLHNIDEDHMYCLIPGKPNLQETSNQPTPLMLSSVNSTAKYCLRLDSSDFKKLSSEVQFPSKDWIWSFNERKKNLFCSNQDFSSVGKLIVKTVQILNVNKALFYINGKPVVTPQLNGDFQCSEDLSNAIKIFDTMKPCFGIENPSLEEVEVSKKIGGVKEGSVWKSKDCTGFSEKKNTCLKCRSLKIYLLKRKRATPKTTDPQEALRRKLKTSRQTVRRMTRHKEATDILISKLRSDYQKSVRESFDRRIKYLNEKEQMIVRAMVAKANVRPGRDNRLTAIRYEPSFLNECELIRKKSSIAYRYLRNSGLLPLPSLTTLDRLRRKASNLVNTNPVSDQTEVTDPNADANDNSSEIDHEMEASAEVTSDPNQVILDSESDISPEMTVVIISSE